MKVLAITLLILITGCAADAPPPNAIDHIARYNEVIIRQPNSGATVAAVILSLILGVVLLGIRWFMRRNEMQIRKDLLREERLAARRKNQ